MVLKGRTSCKTRAHMACGIAKPCLGSTSLRGAKRRSNPYFLSAVAMDCFAEHVIGRRFAPTCWLAMTAWLFENCICARTNALPLPLGERSDRIDRCDPGEGLRSIEGPEPLTPTLSHKGEGAHRRCRDDGSILVRPTLPH